MNLYRKAVYIVVAADDEDDAADAIEVVENEMDRMDDGLLLDSLGIHAVVRGFNFETGTIECLGEDDEDEENES